jgi:hypothetical protein
MKFDEVKALLEEAKANPDVVKADQDELDKVIAEVISIEKKHLYQVETTSTRKRLDEIRKLLDSKLPRIMEG